MFNSAIKIGHKWVGLNHSVYVIAEAGVNHNGRIELAKRLVDAAKAANADAIKFQTFKTENLVTKQASKASYQRRASPYGTQFDMLKKLELSYKDFESVFKYCRAKQITFLSTVFDMESAEFLNKLGVGAFKIGSGDFDNVLLIRKISRFHKPLLLSVGMSSESEIQKVLNSLTIESRRRTILLQCTSCYPTSPENVHLRVIPGLKRKTGLLVGFSDHTMGIELAPAAVALGACVVEKHLTLDKNMSGPDHQMSLEPDDFKKFAGNIRMTEKALGHERKTVLLCEKGIKAVTRKSIIVEADVKCGEKFTEKNLGLRRPKIGIPAIFGLTLLGQRARRDLKACTMIKWGDVVYDNSQT